MLPTRLRIASGVAAVVVYPIVALIVLDSSGLITVDWLPGTGEIAMWVLTVLVAIGASSTSPPVPGSNGVRAR